MTSLTPAQTNRYLLLDADDPEAITAAIKDIEEAYVKAHKRRVTVGLFFSSWTESVPNSPRRKSRFGLTLYAEAGQEDEAKWIVDYSLAARERGPVRV